MIWPTINFSYKNSDSFLFLHLFTIPLRGLYNIFNLWQKSAKFLIKFLKNSFYLIVLQIETKLWVGPVCGSFRRAGSFVEHFILSDRVILN